MPVRRERLARRREAVGLTQEQLAERLGTERSTVWRWEYGRSAPRPEQQPKLARLLGLSPAELVDLIGQQQTSSTPERVEYTLRRPASIDPETVWNLRQQVHDLDERYDRVPSTFLLADVGQALGQVSFLMQHSLRDSVQQELHAVEAATATLMGQLVWDASQRRDHRTAHKYFVQATRAAREIDDPVSEGHALLRTSYLALYGERNPVEGLRLTECTVEATKTTSDVLTGLALLHSAEAHAMLGDARRCGTALAAAESSFARITPTDAAAHLFSPTQFDRLAGSCYLFLGDHRHAQRALDKAAATVTAHSKSRAIVLGNLSLAYLHQRDIDPAIHTLHDAIDVLITTRGGGGLNVVFDAVRKLRRWRSETAVHDIYDRLFSLMTTA